MINTKQLTEELISAGIQTNGCNSNGVVWDKDNKEIQDRPDVKAIVIKHKPKEEPPQASIEEKLNVVFDEIKMLKEKIK